MENLTYYGWGLPIQASTYAQKIDQSLAILHGAMILIFVLWGIFMTYCLIRYRHRPGVGAAYTHQVGLTSYIPDAAILAFEIWLIFLIGVPLWAHIMEKFPKPTEAHTVEVVAEQFTWNFHYPGPDGLFGRKDSALIDGANPVGLDGSDPASSDDIVSVNQLHVPSGRPTLLYLSSKDVIHSLFVPAFRVKRDIVPGMRIPLWFEPILQGTFEIGCAQLCGLGHYRMRGDVVVQSPEEYENWFQEQLKMKEEYSY